MKTIKKLIQSITSEKVLALCFLLFCFYLGLAGFPGFLRNCAEAIETQQDFDSFIDTLDAQYTDMLSMDMDTPVLHNKTSYISLNGQMAGILDQRVVNGRLKLTNGHLAGIDSPDTALDVHEVAENLFKFYQYQADAGKNFLFVLAPSQGFAPAEYLPAGYTDYITGNGDTLLQLLTQRGVPVLDLRQRMEEQGISYTEAFFKTDHHWKPQTGVWAFGELMEHLLSLGYIENLDREIIDPNNYEFKIYEDSFLGSSGRRTGPYFAGVDDFSIIFPKFETNVSVRIPSRNVDKSGRYEDTSYMLNQARIVEMLNKKDFYNTDPYSLYGYSNSPITHWRNESAAENSRFMLIGDSMGNIPFSLMPLCISECDELDMRQYDGDFTAYLSEFNPDTVVILVNANGILNLESQNVSYPFIP